MAVELTELPSGLRVVTDAMDWLETASLGVYFSAGARHESEEEQGLSHLLEHMAFKGTARRDARAIAEAIESPAATSTPRHRWNRRPITPACCARIAAWRWTCWPIS